MHEERHLFRSTGSFSHSPTRRNIGCGASPGDVFDTRRAGAAGSRYQLAGEA